MKLLQSEKDSFENMENKRFENFKIIITKLDLVCLCFYTQIKEINMLFYLV